MPWRIPAKKYGARLKKERLAIEATRVREWRSTVHLDAKGDKHLLFACRFQGGAVKKEHHRML